MTEFEKIRIETQAKLDQKAEVDLAEHRFKQELLLYEATKENGLPLIFSDPFSPSRHQISLTLFVPFRNIEEEEAAGDRDGVREGDEPAEVQHDAVVLSWGGGEGESVQHGAAVRTVCGVSGSHCAVRPARQEVPQQIPLLPSPHLARTKRSLFLLSLPLPPAPYSGDPPPCLGGSHEQNTQGDVG